MRNRKKWLWVAAVAAAILTGVISWTLTHPAEGSRGVLYRVSGGQGEMYLLGSIHIGTQDMYPFGTAIRNAMEQADTFVFECDTASDSAVAQLKARMALPEGQTLKASVGEPLYEEISQVCEKLSLPLSSLDGLKPWAVINTLAVYSTAAELGSTNVNTALSLGVEQQVQAYGQKAGKPFAYLETAMEQTDILEGFSDDLKRYLLKSECDTILNPSAVTGMDASISLWPGWWRQGNTAAFSDQYLRSYLEPGYETVCREYHTKLITSRNEAMTARLSKMLQEDGTFFVTVGLLHLVLPQDGIVARLQALGYTVEQIPMETGTTGEANP